jgi:hypothetical protein
MERTAANPPYPPTVNGLSAALAALGETVDQVADNLADAGHLGERGDTATCPVARYLRAVIPAADDLHVGSVDVSLWPPTGHSLSYIDVLLPPPVVAFLERFDVGQYADLIQPEPPADRW